MLAIFRLTIATKLYVISGYWKISYTYPRAGRGLTGLSRYPPPPPPPDSLAQGVKADEVLCSLRYREPDFSSPAWRDVSASALDLLHKILEKDPAKRIGAEEILGHPWMQMNARSSSLRKATAAPLGSPNPLLDDSARGFEREAGLSRHLQTRARHPSLSLGSADDATRPQAGPGRGHAPPGGLATLGGQASNRVEECGGSCSPRLRSLEGRRASECVGAGSARIFFAPEGQRLQLHAFVDAFKQQVERER